MQNVFFGLLDMGSQRSLGGLFIAIFDRLEQRSVAGNRPADIVFCVNAADTVSQHVASNAVGHLHEPAAVSNL